MPKKKRWVIDSLVLIFSIIIVAQILTYAVPQGTFEREPYPKNPSREMVVPGSYAAVAAEDEVSLLPWHFLTAVVKGLEAVTGDHMQSREEAIREILNRDEE